MRSSRLVPYPVTMRKIMITVSTLMALSAPAFAAETGGPTSLGVFSDWTAASLPGSHVCYAFTRAIGSAKTATAAMIIVTERPTSRDEVVVNATHDYPAKTEVAVQVDDQTAMSFYTAGPHAYSRDGRATVIAMQKGNGASAAWATKSEKKHTEKFSLSGFSAAYGAIVKACPAK
ncbi:hypothetical protein ACELLULO517_16275 [Acidisoma cellulosilytica]|uniref:Uncharacterized protein n=1 Tax=Acidisoma cellulosilyticum TaxID=2802395 RepID=A0A964E4K7_9PROT|nr:hypothetical protein [Acidisoma cellulosilyticum]MCB8881805.1 hypothetical protein [Acidisoma cellulosilyticum]